MGPRLHSDGEPAILRLMFRLSRRLTTALLWIAIALLPVRGWAAVLMPIAMGDMQPAAMANATGARRRDAVPCSAASYCGRQCQHAERLLDVRPLPHDHSSPSRADRGGVA